MAVVVGLFVFGGTCRVDVLVVDTEARVIEAFGCVRDIACCGHGKCGGC